MDTTAAAELGLASEGVNYWAPAATDHDVPWAAQQQDEEEEEDDDDFDADDNRQQWTPPDYRRSNGGEPPLKKPKTKPSAAFNNPQQPPPSYDAFDPSNSRSASGTTTPQQAEYGQGASSGTPPPPEASATSSGGKSNRASIGKMFYKTKLCCKFRAGTCPYLNNCNFAHGMEELRKPPPNWQEIVAQQEERTQRRSGDGHGQHQQMTMTIPSVGNDNDGGGGGSSGSGGRFHKTRFCKKYYTEEGCPYGDRCNFLHDDQGRSRESVAINLAPTTSTGSGNELNANGGGSNNNNNNNNGGNGSFSRPMYWKTRICNKWETTGHCPFGDKCHFAHGVAELQKYGGGLLDSESGVTSGGLRNDLKQSASTLKLHADPGIGPAYSVFGMDNYTTGISNQRSISNFQGQRQGQRSLPKWKGPDKISQIYGDWIEDNEWEYTNCVSVSRPEEVSQIHEEEFLDAQMRVEKWQNVSQGQTNFLLSKGGSEQNNNQNQLSRGGSKGRDLTSLGRSLDQDFEDDTLVGEL